MPDHAETKPSIVIVYTGEGKGKTSAALGLALRALGSGINVAFVQFIKSWDTSEDISLAKLAEAFPGKLIHHKEGEGFYIPNQTPDEAAHQESARSCFSYALQAATSGDYDLVICDEINNAVADGLLECQHLEEIITKRASNTSLCLTGRNFPADLLPKVDIATEMTKLKHHYDDGFTAIKGLDY